MIATRKGVPSSLEGGGAGPLIESDMVVCSYAAGTRAFPRSHTSHHKIVRARSVWSCLERVAAEISALALLIGSVRLYWAAIRLHLPLRFGLLFLPRPDSHASSNLCYGSSVPCHGGPTSCVYVPFHMHQPAKRPDLGLPATYTHIHAFLVKKSHKKAAEALKKAVKDIVVLKEDVTVDGPLLDAIIKEWKELKAKEEESSSYVIISRFPIDTYVTCAIISVVRMIRTLTLTVRIRVVDGYMDLTFRTFSIFRGV